ncbi:hypothetical protein [Nocardioides marmorisolisilvae]|uniref:hypothetical protein n=1 Tax=Nocardioides marmorisolisilvae TaxID=1542737 RepID=UPI0011CD3F6D|nr:hypothetical protein [Nocardioides marmorisolisilvae]
MRQEFEVDTPMGLPPMFCWTKYGTEAGETAETILRRKEAERNLNGGVFLWGIGNAIGPSIEHLLEETSTPRVVFTPMLSRPAAKDIAPPAVGMWRRGVGMDGTEVELPEHSRVTSRLSNSGRAHYALVCRSVEPLFDGGTRSAEEGFEAAHVVNLRSGSRVGASQVTSVVRRVACALGSGRKSYQVTFVADLVAPYLIRLTDHVVVSA